MLRCELKKSISSSFYGGLRAKLIVCKTIIVYLKRPVKEDRYVLACLNTYKLNIIKHSAIRLCYNLYIRLLYCWFTISYMANFLSIY